jgi:16S rRNA (cytosine1402-N4)-methyltransferase
LSKSRNGCSKRILGAVIRSVKPGGRLSVISYHSLEEIGKTICENGMFGEPERSNFSVPFKTIGKLVPDKEDKLNNRARSAKLRIAERYNSACGVLYNILKARFQR